MRRRRRGLDEGGGPETADIRVWINGADTPQEARDWLKTTFEDQNPGSTLTIEEQEWEGLVERLTTALSASPRRPTSSRSATPRHRRSPTAGAFSDLTDELGDLGGDDLLPGFVDGATVDGATYAVPYYAGSKYVFYRKDLFEKLPASRCRPRPRSSCRPRSTSRRPTPSRPNFSGFWFPGQDWRNGVSFIWNAGGDLAVEDGGEWKGTLSTARVGRGAGDRPDR